MIIGHCLSVVRIFLPSQNRSKVLFQDMSTAEIFAVSCNGLRSIEPATKELLYMLVFCSHFLLSEDWSLDEHESCGKPA